MNCGSVVLRRICVLASHVHICLPYMPHQNHVIEQRNFDKISMLNYQPQWGKHSSSNKKTSKERGNYNISLSSSPHSPNPQCNCHENKVLFLLPCLPPPLLHPYAKQQRKIVPKWHHLDLTQDNNNNGGGTKKETEVLSFFCFIVDGRVGNGSEGWGFFCPTVLEKEKDNCPLERDSQFWPPLYIFFFRLSFSAKLKKAIFAFFGCLWKGDNAFPKMEAGEKITHLH